MASADDLTREKRKLSGRLLDEAGISGVGLRDARIVVYLVSDDAAVKKRATAIARELGIEAELLFETAGEFRKQ
jgi:hypothetical protein